MTMLKPLATDSIRRQFRIIPVEIIFLVDFEQWKLFWSIKADVAIVLLLKRTTCTTVMLIKQLVYTALYSMNQIRKYYQIS